MATKRMKRPAVPEAVALRKIERQVSKAKPEMQPELRAALRRGLEAGGHFRSALHCLNIMEIGFGGTDPEDSLIMLAYAVEDMAALVANVQGVMAGARSAA